MRVILSEKLYGEPATAVPVLCGAIGFAVGVMAGSWLVGSTTAALSWGIWNTWSPKLVIDDLRLGPLILECPLTGPAGEPQIWLTFDDGPGPETLEIIGLLNSFDLPATFFFIGEQLQSYPDLELLARELRQGHHTVANHTWSHRNLLSLSAAEMRLEMESTQRVLESTFTELCVPLFRPPFGYRNRETFRIAHELQLEIVGWNLNSLDFLNGCWERVPRRVSRLLKPGAVLLFHDGRCRRQRTVSALATCLQRLKHEGYGAYSPK